MEIEKKFFSHNSKTILGIQILRMILSLWVVVIHCCSYHYIKKKKILKLSLHVPTFLILSFFFLYRHLINRNINKIKQRFERLLIPYFIYPIVVFINNNIICKLFQKEIYNNTIPIKYLIDQLIFGINVHGILWFHFYLINLTLFFSIISFIFKKHFLFILQIISIICYKLQFSNIVFLYFRTYKEKPHYCMGSIIEILPYSVTGLSLCSFNLFSKLKKNKFKIFIFNIMILYLIESSTIFNTANGFRYPGIKLNLGAICLLIIFILIPFEKIKNQIIRIFLKIITNYTGGIYLLHNIIRDNLNKRVLIIKKKTINGAILIYLFSYFICLIGTKIFGNTKLVNLFN